MTNRLQELRHKMAIHELATRAGVSSQTIVSIEKYGLVPQNRTRQKLATALGVAQADIWPHLAQEEVPA